MTISSTTTCEHCPAFMKHLDNEGREVLVPMRGADGQQITKDGAPQHEKGADGRFLFSGNCCLRAPVVDGAATRFPAPKSNWFCHDPDKYAMLDRIAAANSGK